MIVKWFAHLPGVALGRSDEFPIGPGKLEKLTFDQWFELDGSFPYNEKDYLKSQPVFYVCEADFPDDIEMPERKIMDHVYQIYLSFLMHPGTPILPNPQMSALYMKIETGFDDEKTLPDPQMSALKKLKSITLKRFGPFEREWIVFGGRVRFVFDDILCSEIKKIYEKLSEFEPINAFAGVEAGIETLALTARPEFWWDENRMNHVNDFIHCMSALEHIILPSKDEDSKRTITEIFGQHAAVFTSLSRDDLNKYKDVFSNLYRLRSRLIHGEIGITNLNKEELNSLVIGRRLLRHTIFQAMALCKTKIDNESLPFILTQAYENADIYDSLFQRLKEVNK